MYSFSICLFLTWLSSSWAFDSVLSNHNKDCMVIFFLHNHDNYYKKTQRYIYIHIYILNMWLLSLFNIRIKTSALHFNKLITHFCIQETGHSLLTWQEHSLLQDLDHMRSHNFNLIPASFQLIIRKCTDFLVKNQKTLLVSLGHRIQSLSPL